MCPVVQPVLFPDGHVLSCAENDETEGVRWVSLGDFVMHLQAQQGLKCA